MSRSSHHLNPPSYDGKPDPVAFEDWINRIDQLFETLQCPEKWRVDFAVFYLTGQASLWWKIVKEKKNEPGFGWSKLQDLMRDKFYPPSLRKQKEDEFLHLQQVLLRESQNSNFKRRNDGRNDNQGGAKRSNQGSQNFRRNSGQLIIGVKVIMEECAKCGRRNHSESECRVGSNACYRCGSRDHYVRDCPKPPGANNSIGGTSSAGTNRNRNNNTAGAYRNPPRQAPTGRIYVMRQDEAENDDTIINGTFSIHSLPVHVLFDSGASHSFISPLFAKNLNLQPSCDFSSLSVALPTGETVRCRVMYRNCPIVLGKVEFLVDLVEFELSDLM
ncbi:uncharacterized protein LOC130589830 [Beta vulgaris subsp. vulgaris]|uniref:uncharacterized protein LOC130589830 n=1 Tax=Beta vulgaris subsp. vulgaris TaxID=3555 RepID=UPI002547E4E1|nr:uncharacterized protein LOC130589830 [Beta vulgaris subsp. vulgaris]